MKRFLFYTISVIVFMGNLFGQEFRTTATAGFVFLEIPVSARDAALGESAVGLSDIKSDGVFTNPAATGFSTQLHSLSTSYAPWFADIKHYGTSYSYKSDVGVFSIGLNYFNFGTMQRTEYRKDTREIIKLGTFSASAMAMGFTYSKMLTDKFAYGITGKYVRESIDIFSADNFLFDGGVLYYTGFSSLRIGASIQNFGVKSKYRNDVFKMPSVLKLGLASELYGGFGEEFRLTGTVEVRHPKDGLEKVNTGLEMSYREMIILRFGYKFFYDEESYSFGIGLSPQLRQPFNLDFAYADYGRLGGVIRLSMQLGLN